MSNFKQVAIAKAYQDGLRRCPCCGIQLVWKSNVKNPQKNLATVDHIVPKSMGGADNHENMFVMCRKCNEIRGNTCFVKFVTERGYSKTEAEMLYKHAHFISVRYTLSILINQNLEQKAKTKYRKFVREIVKNYKKYFNEYLPEFFILPIEFCN